MEILGIFWAASILTPASVVSAATNPPERGFQQSDESLLEETVAWFAALASSFGWMASPQQASPAFSSYVSSASWLLPDLNQLTIGAERAIGDESSGEQFVSLVPAIGTGLTSFETTSEEGDVPILASEEKPIFDNWHSWNAIAAIRFEEAVTDESTPSNANQALIDNACLQAPADYQPMPIVLKAAPKTQLWVHNHFIGDVSGQVTATKIASRLRNLLRAGSLDPASIAPLIGESFVGARHRDDILFVVDETMRSHPELPAVAIAIQWVNNLRLAFNEAPLGLAEVQMAIEGLTETSNTLYGTASWYGPGFHGRKTANGEIFNENALTAAHKTLPFNTHLKVTNRMNGKSIVVRINDRGPYIGKRSLDLSKAAAHCLGSTHNGVIPYEAVILQPVEKPNMEELTATIP